MAWLTAFPFPARRQSGSFLSTGWFTMIVALELCEEIVVYGMVSDSYCRSGQPGPGWEGSWGGWEDRGPLRWPPTRGSRSCGVQGVWPSWWAAGAQTSLGLVPGKKGLRVWDRLDVTLCSASMVLGQSHSLPEPPFPHV